MTNIPADLSPFDPDQFFARARQRLAASGRRHIAGDHILNPEMGGRLSYRDAAVLIPVIARTPPSVLFTLRTPRLSSHAGQVAFPGGKIDPSDASAAAAALREAEEEIGLDPRSVMVIGELDPYLTGTGYRVFPILGRVPTTQAFRLNHNEVEEIFEVPLPFLMAPGNILKKSRVLGGRERTFYELEFQGHIIWGATAGIIASLYQRMYG